MSGREREMLVPLWSSLWFLFKCVRVGQMTAWCEFAGRCWRPLCPYVHPAGNGRARDSADNCLGLCVLCPDRDSGDILLCHVVCGVDRSRFVDFLQSMEADDGWRDGKP